jgi:hypothetical protein
MFLWLQRRVGGRDAAIREADITSESVCATPGRCTARQIEYRRIWNVQETVESVAGGKGTASDL